MVGLWLILIVLFSSLLIKVTDILIVNLQNLAKKTHLRKFAVGSLLIGLATSLPELFVGITATLRGQSALALGNVVGANIANLSLVIGGAALFGGSVAVQGEFVNKEVFYAFLAGAAPMLLLFDRYLSRTDGLLLLCLYGLYCFWAVQKKEKSIAPTGNKKGFPNSQLAKILVATILLLFSADMVVVLSQKIAYALNIPLLLIGLFIVSVGTTFPEFIFELEAIREHQSSMVFGNLLGIIVTHSTLVSGLVAVIRPFKLQAFPQYLVATMAFAVIFGFFYFFVRSKHRLERWEGALLLLVYFVFIFLEFGR